MEKALADQLEALNKNLNTLKPTKTNFLVDGAVKIGTAICTLGVVAIFVLFNQTIPALQSSVDQLHWQAERMEDDLKELKDFAKQPRFTKQDDQEALFLLKTEVQGEIGKIKSDLDRKIDLIQASAEERKDLKKRVYELEAYRMIQENKIK